MASRTGSRRPKMSREERAKQFMPFAALKGYEEALHQKEKIVVEKVELSEEMKEELDRQFMRIQKNDMVSVVYYAQEEYLQIKGMVAKVDADARVIRVVNTKIKFDDIYRVELLN